MEHTVTLIDHRQLSDGQVAICARCCNDEKTHSWLTMAAEVVNDSTQRQNAINFHVNRVATLHQSMQTALATLPGLMGTATQVTVPDEAIASASSVPTAAVQTVSA
jgi:hypothetical protein